jgi:hypothetical protein
VAQIWQQQEDEQIEWYRRFETYLAIGSNRSVLAVYRAEADPKARSVPGSWKAAVKRHNWQQRAFAWDVRVDDVAAAIAAVDTDIARSGLDRATPKPDRAARPEKPAYERFDAATVRRMRRQIDWEAEREALRQRQIDMAEALYQKAEEMLGYNLDGEGAAQWSMRDAVTFMKTASDLTQAAIVMGEEQASRKQLAGWHYLAQQLLTMDDGEGVAAVKQLLAAFLDASLLDLGKPARGQMKATIEAARLKGD